jgi:catechol 2,3-dioxygenase-like lactoylglutathione lyase family enzyme
MGSSGVRGRSLAGLHLLHEWPDRGSTHPLKIFYPAVMAPAAYKDLCLDAGDRLVMGRFWAAVLGLELVDRGDGVAYLRGPTPAHTVWIAEVPGPKTVKNRMHLDVHTASLDELLALGATVLQEFPRWTVMADPEGGEFCAFVREEPPSYRLYEVVLDAADHRTLGRWWADLLGGRCIDEGKGFVSIADIPGAPFEYLDVGSVPEPRTAKNRVHLDLVGDTAEIVARGATLLAELPRWNVLADIEGNEFCVFPPT